MYSVNIDFVLEVLRDAVTLLMREEGNVGITEIKRELNEDLIEKISQPAEDWDFPYFLDDRNIIKVFSKYQEYLAENALASEDLGEYLEALKDDGVEGIDDIILQTVNFKRAVIAHEIRNQLLSID
ncbi:hypothetical protein [Parasutterella muris]|uniref:hypothetical protein n=1 Tax=Parasutterella muris TaxID=2565572 RepID=UPI002041F7F5|nr:hypothetical protein [Parasutterella muris]